MKEAKALIEGSGYRMIMTDNLDDAAAKAVKIADIVRQVNKLSCAASKLRLGFSHRRSCVWYP